MVPPAMLEDDGRGLAWLETARTVATSGERLGVRRRRRPRGTAPGPGSRSRSSRGIDKADLEGIARVELQVARDGLVARLAR